MTKIRRAEHLTNGARSFVLLLIGHKLLPMHATEHSLSTEAIELAQDARFAAAAKALQQFKDKHWSYLNARDRIDPNTGQLYVQRRRGLDQEHWRLWCAVRDANWVRH